MIIVMLLFLLTNTMSGQAGVTNISKGIVVTRFSITLNPFIITIIGYPSWRDAIIETLKSDVGHCHDARCRSSKTVIADR